MKLDLYHGDILDLNVDVLVCSANVSLNLSGGVGGALMSRYGVHLQVELHKHLPANPPRYAKQGDVIVTHPSDTPYKAVIHAVAVDAFYDSSPPVITNVCRRAFQLASQEGAKSVALTALATGYGHLTIAQFVKGLLPALGSQLDHFERIVVGMQSDSMFAELRGLLSAETAF